MILRKAIAEVNKDDKFHSKVWLTSQQTTRNKLSYTMQLQTVQNSVLILVNRRKEAQSNRTCSYELHFATQVRIKAFKDCG